MTITRVPLSLPTLQQYVPVTFHYNVYFTERLFDLNNPLLSRVMTIDGKLTPKRAIAVVDSGLLPHHPKLLEKIQLYAEKHRDFLNLCTSPVVVIGGETVKNEPKFIDNIHALIDQVQLCRHSYINNPDYTSKVHHLLENAQGVAQVLDEQGKKAYGLDHPRSGELVAIAKDNAWFTYYYWLDDQYAPDFGRTVDIHRKPGYDPVELFLDPQIRFPKLKIASILLKKQLGFRYLMDVIPLDASLVKGSHGIMGSSTQEWPICITSQGKQTELQATDICSLILQHLKNNF